MLSDQRPPTDWMKKATRAAADLSATTTGTRGASHRVYVILLRDSRRAEPWGLYVGQTSRDPDIRFDQHKAGYKASSAARRFGIRLLPALVAHLNPLRGWESLELEAGLAEEFRRAGIAWVAGGH
jgi:predicted GIY-YIG superfamily endonuclease